MKQQNTHWYKADQGGWTANPLFASQGEVEKVGLHDCFIQGCEEAHCGTSEEVVTEFVYAAEVAREATSNKRAKELRSVKKGKTHSS